MLTITIVASMLVLIALSQVAANRERKLNQRWLASLECQECGTPLAGRLELARVLTLKSEQAIREAAYELELRINRRRPTVRFPCQKCGTVYVLTGQQTCVVDESQEFEWPDPERDAITWKERMVSSLQQHERQQDPK